MNKIHTIRLFAAAVVLAAGAGSAARELKPQVLSKAWFTKMDKDQDGKVAKAEYVDYGVAYQTKNGKPVNRALLEDKFAQFDRNEDGFITERDPGSQIPEEALKQTILGTWSSKNSRNGPVSFAFRDDGQAVVIQNGASLREKLNGTVSYRFVPSDGKWVCVDIIIKRREGHNYIIKCIIAPMSENQIKLRMASGEASYPS